MASFNQILPYLLKGDESFYPDSSRYLVLTGGLKVFIIKVTNGVCTAVTQNLHSETFNVDDKTAFKVYRLEKILD